MKAMLLALLVLIASTSSAQDKGPPDLGIVDLKYDTATAKLGIKSYDSCQENNLGKYFLGKIQANIQVIEAWMVKNGIEPWDLTDEPVQKPCDAEAIENLKEYLRMTKKHIG